MKVSPVLGSRIIGVGTFWQRNGAAHWPWSAEDAGLNPLRERVQSVALAVSSAEPRKRVRGVVFTGTNEGDGTSTVTMAVARVLTNALGLKPLVVEMNCRRPCLANRLDLVTARGSVHAFYADGALLADCVHCDPSGLSLVPAGGQWPSAAAAKIACQILQDAEPDYDVVLFDSPPIFESADALASATSAKEMIVVVKAKSTSRQSLAEIKPMAERSGVVIRGAIVTSARSALPRWLDRLLVR